MEFSCNKSYFDKVGSGVLRNLIWGGGRHKYKTIILHYFEKLEIQNPALFED